MSGSFKNTSHNFMVVLLLWVILLQDLFMSLVSVSQSLINISDILLLIMGIKLLINSRLKSRILTLLIAVFSTYLIFVSIVLGGDPILIIAKLWVTFRFVILYLFITKFCGNMFDLARLACALQNAIVILTGIAVLQILNTPFTHDFYTLSEGVKTFGEEETAKGFFKYGVHLAFFLLAAEIALCAISPSLKHNWIRMSLVMLVILFSGSRIISIFYAIFMLFHVDKKIRNFLFPSVTLALIAMFYSIDQSQITYSQTGSLMGLLTAKYWEASLLTGRLGVYALMQFSVDLPIQTWLFGFGFNVSLLEQFFANYLNYWPALLRNNFLVGLEDAYWVYLLLNFGIIGTTSFLAIFCFLFVRLRSEVLISDVLTKLEANHLYGLLIFAFSCLFIGNFINQFFSNIYFSFGFWLFLGAVHLKANSRALNYD